MQDVRARAEAANAAARGLSQATDAERCAALLRLAELLDDERARVEEANRADVEACQEAVRAGEMAPALLDRLKLQGEKLDQAIHGVRAVADQQDPLGRTVRATLLDDGLELRQVTVPLGVVACAYESRPDAGVQMASLAVKSANAILLKGGREAKRTNRVVAELARQALEEAGLAPDAVVLLEEREELQALLDLDALVDLVVPRGSADFVRYVQDHTRIPVLGHADGLCHTYVDAAADLDQALAVCLDAKLDYPAACNATESFLVHQAVARPFVPRLVEALQERGVEVRADLTARNLAPAAKDAGADDWGREWGDRVCALRVVGSLEEALDHIATFGSGHTEAILTTDEAAAGAFQRRVDAAGVFVNASTRFADGYRYGLGAEVGISSGKVHARGPVGLEGLTTTKWLLTGQGHVAGDYQGENARPFRHEPLEGA